MPFSEIHTMVKGKLESTQSKMTNCSADFSFIPDNEFVELLWENGQIVKQGQSSRTKRNPFSNGFSSHALQTQEKNGKDAGIPKNGRIGSLDSVLNDFSPTVPSGHGGLAQDDDMVPWLNYPVDDSLHNDYCSEFFSELSGANLNLMLGQNNVLPADRSGNYSRMVKESHVVSAHSSANLEHGNASKGVGGSSETDRFNGNQFFPSSQRCQTSAPDQRLKVPDPVIRNISNAEVQNPCKNSSQTPVTIAMANGKIQKKDVPYTCSSQPNTTSLMNFSHFSRPAALVKANLESIGFTSSGFSGLDRLRSADKMLINCTNSVEPSSVESNGGPKSVSQVSSQPALLPAKGEPKSTGKLPQELVSAEKSDAICQEDASRNNLSPDPVHCESSSFAASAAMVRPESEPVVASSSVCSGNSTGGASNDGRHGMKRKAREVEESECPSEDVEDESMDARKPTTGRGTTKRSRAAEVHNLSERRRRDRINEKMRALQELIPNCNKVDKASMLDEAIEYLKTLQLQVQIMSMGSGLYMPPIILPPGMQPVHSAHMAHFSPMGVGMGMGLGFGMGMGMGMGMLDAGGSSGCSFIPVPPVRGPQFPCSAVSGGTSLQRMPGSAHQMFGVPGRGQSVSMPPTPIIPLSGFITRPVSVTDVSWAATSLANPDPGPTTSSKDQMQNWNLQTVHKSSPECSQIQASTQATNECFEPSDIGQRNHIPLANSNEVVNNNGNGIAPS